MTLSQLIKQNRSYRRFHQNEKISIEELSAWVDLARLSPSARNSQPLKYILSADDETNNKIFETLAWAGYLKDWPGPEEGERPTAYIIVLADTKISKDFFCDHGIATQSILLGAVEKGFGGCIIAAVKRPKLRELLLIPEHFDILYVIALGKPKEEVVIDSMENDDIKYWRDKNNVHHVPKRSLDEVIWKGEKED